MASDIAYGILKFIFVSTFHFQCILSSIIIVALKGIFRKIADLRRLWPLSRIDFSIWLVSFVSTVCWDVSQGLVISIGEINLILKFNFCKFLGFALLTTGEKLNLNVEIPEIFGKNTNNPENTYILLNNSGKYILSSKFRN